MSIAVSIAVAIANVIIVGVAAALAAMAGLVVLALAIAFLTPWLERAGGPAHPGGASHRPHRSGTGCLTGRPAASSVRLRSGPSLASERMPR